MNGKIEEDNEHPETDDQYQWHREILHSMLTDAVEVFKSPKSQDIRSQGIRNYHEPFRKPEVPQEKLIATIRAIMEGEKGEPQFNAVRQVRDIARNDPRQIEDTLRIALIEAFRYMRKNDVAHGLTPTLGYALEEFGGIDIIKMFVEMNYYGICGAGAWNTFHQFPEESILLLTEKISQPTTSRGKVYDGLYLLGDMVGRYKQGSINISKEKRDLLVTTARHYLKGNLQLLHGGLYSVSDLAEAAIRFSVMLDDPDLIEIVEELVADPRKVIALGVPQDRVESIQESASMYLGWCPMIEMISDC